LELDAGASARFEDAVVLVMSELKGALAELVDRLPGSSSRGVDVARSLGLDNKLAWQVVRLATAAEPVGEIENVPSAPSVRRLLAAIRKQAQARSSAERVERAFASFEAFTARHGTDRESIVSMVNGLSSHKDEAFDLKVRETVFKGQAYLWGLRAAMMCRTSITLPCAPGEPVKRVIVSGNVGVQRVREGATVTLSSWARRGVPGSQVSAEALAQFGEEKEPGFEFLEKFCTQPLPQMMPRASVKDTLEIEMLLPTVGGAGAVTMYMTHTIESGTDPRVLPVGLRVLVSMPVEELVTDLMVPEGWTSPATARVMVYGRRHHPEHVFDERTIDLLSQREKIEHVGVRTGVPEISGAPQNAEAVAYELERNGCKGVRFDVYRCRVRYPVMHSLVAAYAGAWGNPKPG
jgi:hypothetical protein